jgi:hypothetical protein
LRNKLTHKRANSLNKFSTAEEILEESGEYEESQSRLGRADSITPSRSNMNNLNKSTSNISNISQNKSLGGGNKSKTLSKSHSGHNIIRKSNPMLHLGIVDQPFEKSLRSYKPDSSNNKSRENSTTKPKKPFINYTNPYGKYFDSQTGQIDKKVEKSLKN